MLIVVQLTVCEFSLKHQTQHFQSVNTFDLDNIQNQNRTYRMICKQCFGQ